MKRAGCLPSLLLAAAGAALALGLALAAAHAWLTWRPVSGEERALRDEGKVYGALLAPAATPRLRRLGWVALRPDLRVRRGEVEVATNNLGFRDLPHPAEKEPGVFRVVVIGDSYVYGQGVRRVEDLFPHRLGLASIGGRPVEALLMGYCGANLEVYDAMLQDLALPLRPDAVVVSLISNDLEQRGGSAPCLPAPAALALRWSPALLAEAERRCNTLTRHYERQLRERFDPASEPFRRGREALARMKAAADGAGVDLLAFFFEVGAWRGGEAERMDAAYGSMCAELGIPYASLPPATGRLVRAGELTPADLVVSTADGHPSVLAHALAGRVVGDLLRAHYGAAAAGEAAAP